MRSLLSKAILVILVLVVISYAWLLFNPPGSQIKELQEKAASQQSRPDLYFQGVTLSEISDGVKYWEIYAKKSSINKSKNVTELYNIKGIFFDDDSPVLGFESPAANWDMKNKRITMQEVHGFTLDKSKDIKVKNIEPYKESHQFWADIMYWNLETKKVMCDKNVEYKYKDMHLTALAMKADVGMKDIVITGKPKMLINE